MRWKLFALAAAVMLVGGFGERRWPAPASATVFKDHPIILLNRSISTQFAPIGELEGTVPFRNTDGSMVTEYGSAVLVSPCYALTNYHVVFRDLPVGAANETYAMNFNVGFKSDGSGFAGKTKATPILWGEKDDKGHGDWALMKLTTCVGDARFNLGWFDVFQGTALALPGKEVGCLGFGSDDRGRLSYSLGKVISIDSNNGLLRTSCSIIRGESGGGVFMIEGGRLELVGINTQMLLDPVTGKDATAEKYSDDRANEFLMSSEVVYRSDILRLLADDIRAHGGINAAADRFNRPLPIPAM